jgi:predicted membrane protein DUF2339
MEGSSSNHVDDLDRRVQRLEGEVADLKDLVAFAARKDPLLLPPPPVEPELPPEPIRQAWIETARTRRREQVAAPRFTFDPAALFGARSLAWAGGFVMLGILFFFVLAVNRGWIGPTARVALGAAASVLAFGAGIWLRRRFGETHSALVSVGVGLAGGFGTLLAAASLYQLLPGYAALVVAAGIALAGVATSLVWRSELVAAFGLVGAALVPVAVVAQGGLTTLGPSFAAIVFAATALVAVQQRWRWLLIAGAWATLPQVAVLVGRQGGLQWQLTLLAGVASCLSLGAGIAWHRRTEAPPLGSLTISLVAAGASLAVYSALRLYGTEEARGIAVLAVALVLGSSAAAFFRSPRLRDLSALLGAASLAAGAISFGELMSGQPLAYAWAAEAAALAWLARRIREVRYQMLSLVYLGLALLHVTAIDAPPRQLFEVGSQPGAGALAALAVSIAIALFGRQARTWHAPFDGPLVRFLTPFQAGQQNLRAGSFWVAGVLATYAAALGLLQLFVSAGAGFGWGHVAVDGAWAAAGLGILLAGLRRDSRQIVSGGFAWLGTTALIAVLYDWKHLAIDPRSAAFLLLAGFALAAGIAYQVRRRTELVAGIGDFSVVASLAFALAAVIPLASTQHLVGASLLGLAAVYGSLSALLFGRRDLATLLGGLAAALAAVAAPLLVDGTWVVLAWAMGSVVLSATAARLEEPRLKLAALAYLAFALGDALCVQAPPSDLFRVHLSPAAGVPAMLLGLAALAVFGRFERHVAVRWTGGIVALYAASLSILELVERISPAGLQTDFQRGHSAISGFWGLVGLVLLYVGLTRRPALRIAGFALFGVSLGKLFLYDLTFLDSITRALSFLAVGALLLTSGFFYQRLADGRDG